MFEARILLLTHEFAPFRGGIAEVADGLATGAAAAGCWPLVLAPDYGKDHTRSDRARPYRVLRFRGGACSMLSVDGLLRFTRLCHRAIREQRADLVHAVDPPAQMAVAMLSRLRLAPPFASTVHGTELLRYRREAMPRIWLGGGLRRAAGIHAVSRFVCDRLETWFGVQPGQSFVVHPGIRRTWLETPSCDRAAVRRTHHLGSDDFALLTLSRRVPEKGHEDAIAALATLPRSARDRVVYIIAGTGPREYAERLLAAAQNASVRIRMQDEVSDEAAIALADAADLFVMPSHETPTRLEGFGITYIEAAARGLPSIARATGGVAEAVRDGETGRVLDADAGPPELGRAVLNLMEQDETRTRLGRLARSHAQSFAWDRKAAAIYERLFLAMRGN